MICFAIEFWILLLKTKLLADFTRKCEYNFAKKTAFAYTILAIKIQFANTILISGMQGFASKVDWKYEYSADFILNG